MSATRSQKMNLHHLLISLLFLTCAHSAFQTFLGGSFNSFETNPHVASWSIGSDQFWSFNYGNDDAVVGLNGKVVDIVPFGNQSFFFTGLFDGLQVRSGAKANESLPVLNGVAMYQLEKRMFAPLGKGIENKGNAALQGVVNGDEFILYGNKPFSVVNGTVKDVYAAVWNIDKSTWATLALPKCKNEKVVPVSFVNSSDGLYALFTNKNNDHCIYSFVSNTGNWSEIPLPSGHVEVNVLLNYGNTSKLLIVGNFKGTPTSKDDKYYPCKIFDNNNWNDCAGFVSPAKVDDKLVYKITSAILNNTHLIIGGTFSAKGGENIASDLVYGTKNETQQFLSYGKGLKAAKGNTDITAIVLGPAGANHFLLAAGNFKSSTFATAAWCSNEKSIVVWSPIYLNSSDTVSVMVSVHGSIPQIPETFPTEEQILIFSVVFGITFIVLIFGCCGLCGLPEKRTY